MHERKEPKSGVYKKKSHSFSLPKPLSKLPLKPKKIQDAKQRNESSDGFVTEEWTTLQPTEKLLSLADTGCSPSTDLEIFRKESKKLELSNSSLDSNAFVPTSCSTFLDKILFGDFPSGHHSSDVSGIGPVDHASDHQPVDITQHCPVVEGIEEIQVDPEQSDYEERFEGILTDASSSCLIEISPRKEKPNEALQLNIKRKTLSRRFPLKQISAASSGDETLVQHSEVFSFQNSTSTSKSFGKVDPAGRKNALPSKKKLAVKKGCSKKSTVDSSLEMKASVARREKRKEEQKKNSRASSKSNPKQNLSKPSPLDLRKYLPLDIVILLHKGLIPDDVKEIIYC